LPQYAIKGYLGTTKNPRNYTVIFKYPRYKDVVKTFKVEDKKLVGDLAKDIHFEFQTIDSKREENLEKITGFGCNELMPRYLVGANCVENKTLEGDAIDLAVWIQKFGGKITSIITLLAVLLIIWNAFKIVSAAGDDTQISEAKKGIMWTIIGLALTMFAYIIVKTVIMLTYSQ